MLGLTKPERVGLALAAGIIAFGTGWAIADFSVGGPLTSGKTAVPSIDAQRPPVLGVLAPPTPLASIPALTSAVPVPVVPAPVLPSLLRGQALTPTSNERPLETISAAPESGGQGGGDDQTPPATTETPVRATVTPAPSSGRATVPPEESSVVVPTTSAERTRVEPAGRRDSVRPGQSVREERSRSGSNR